MQFTLKYQALTANRDLILNKLAVLAFTLLLFFSTMLWYLANGSLNEYLKSQIELQGSYYTKQTTTLALANFSASNNSATFSQLHLQNKPNSQASHAIIIDQAYAELSVTPSQPLLTTIEKITIDTLIVNIEQKRGEKSNIEQLTNNISLILANDFPELYPAISAKIYAEKNPELNADAYAKKHLQAGAIVEHTKRKTSRSKPIQKIIINGFYINTLILNAISNGTAHSIKKHNIKLAAIGGSDGLVLNQLGGEVLLHLLQLANQPL